MARHINGTIAERSRTQLGLITTLQARNVASQSQIRHLIDSGALERLEPRVLRVAGAPTSWEQMLHAGILGLGADAVVSHRSAAALWQLDGIRPGDVEFTVPRRNRNRIAVGRVHSSLYLEPVDVARVGGFPATAAARTIVDLAPRLTRRQLETVIDGACRDRLTDESTLAERADELRRPGRKLLLQVLGADSGTGRPHTWLERELIRILHGGGITGFRMQTELTPQGKVARVDCCLEGDRLIVEVSGHRTHSTRRQRQADAERRLRLEQDGYRVLEFTYEDVTERPAYVLQAIVARLRLAN